MTPSKLLRAAAALAAFFMPVASFAQGFTSINPAVTLSPGGPVGTFGSAFPASGFPLGILNSAGTAMTYVKGSNASSPNAMDVNLVGGGVPGSNIAAIATDGNLIQTRGLYGASTSAGAPLTATGSVNLNLTGYVGGVVTVTGSGTFVGRFEYSDDGTTYIPMTFMGNANSDAAAQVNIYATLGGILIPARPNTRFTLTSCTSCSVSVSYTPWYDAPSIVYGTVSATLQTGSSLIGDIGLNRINVTGSQSVASAAAAHATDTCFGGVITFANATKNLSSTGLTGTTGKVKAISVTFGSSTVPASLEVVFLNAALTTNPCTADAGSFAITTADGPKIVGSSGALTAVVKGSNTFVSSPLDIPYSLASSQTIYAYVVNRGTSVTPAAAITANALFERN